MAKLTDLIGSYDNLDEAPSLLNHPSNILAITIVFMVLSFICALLRLYTRVLLFHSAGWDDFFITLSLLSTLGGTIAICVATVHGGLGCHFLSLGVAGMINYLKIFYFANAFYPTSAGLIKIALLFQYLRVYDRASVFRIAAKVMICVVAMWSISYSAVGWIPTWPVQAYWNLEMKAVRYGFGTLYVGPFVAIYSSLTATNMVLDLVVLGLAAPLLLMNKGSETVSRWSLVSLFGIGSLASIMSIWRLASIIETRAATWPTFDPTWYGATPIVLAVLEVDIATITASLPVFWPVLRQLHQNQILVTREVQIVREDRRRDTAGTSSDPDDEGIELQRSDSVLRLHSKHREHYGDPYVAQQVNPFKGLELEFGTRAAIDVSPLGRKASVTSYGTKDAG